MFNFFKKTKQKNNISNDPTDRNLLGKELEKEGEIDKAIELYEKNIKEEFEGNHPYDRLAIIYRKRKQYQEEIRVLNKAITVFEKEKKSSKRADITPKLKRFKERLNKAKSLANENKE